MEYQSQDIEVFQRDYQRYGKYDLLSQVPHLAKLAEYYEEKYIHTQDWKVCLKAHSLYNSISARRPADESWNKKAFQLQKKYWKDFSTITYTQQSRETDKLKRELHNIRETCRSSMAAADGIVAEYEQTETYDEQSTLNQKLFEMMKGISLRCTEMMRELAGHIIEASLRIVAEETPCHFEAVAIGSLARGEATPYSDLEYLFLIEKETPEIESYFEKLAVTSYFVIGNLGETKLSYMAIDELKGWFDDQSKNGFKIDGLSAAAGNIPTGNGTKDKKNHFIVSPQTLADNYQNVFDHPTDDARQGDLTAMLAFTKTFYVHRKGEGCLMRLFRTKITPLQPKKSRQEMDSKMLRYDFKKHLDLLNLAAQLYNSVTISVKKEIFRFPSLVILDLSILMGYHKGTSWDTVEFMTHHAKHLRFHEFCEVLKFLFACATYLRLSAYLFYDSHDDRMTAAKKWEPSMLQTEILKTPYTQRYFVPDELFISYCIKINSIKLIDTTQLMLPHKREKLWALMKEFIVGNRQEAVNLMASFCEEAKSIGAITAGAKLAMEVGMSKLDGIRIVAAFMSACEMHQEALTVYQHINDIMKYDSRVEIAGCYSMMGFHREALEVLGSIRHKSSATLVELARTAGNLYDLELAETYCIKILQVEHRSVTTFRHKKIMNFLTALPEERLNMISKETANTITSVTLLGSIYSSREQYDLSEKYLVKAYQLVCLVYGENAAVPAAVSVLNCLSTNLLGSNNPEDAKNVSLSSIAINRLSPSKDSKPLMACSLGTLGQSYLVLQDYKKAEACFYQSLARGRGNSYLVGIFRLIKLYYILGDYYKGLEFSYQAWSHLLRDSKEEQVKIAYALCTIAGVHFYKGEHGKARVKYRKVLQILLRKSPSDRLIAEVQRRLSLVPGPYAPNNPVDFDDHFSHWRRNGFVNQGS